MFGYYALAFWNSQAFWIGVDRNSPHWSLFAHFVDQMSRVEETFLDRPAPGKLGF
jgi:hypothetical protein